MKGFKPVGPGPSVGFRFPASMGFTGSTGSLTNVSPHVRRKAFANGGFVRQDNPRMTRAVVGDSGSALVRRSTPTTQLDQESGGRSPLRPGFKRGGNARVKKADGGDVRAKGHGPIKPNPKKLPPAGGIKGKIYAADGGEIRRDPGFAPRRIKRHSLAEGVRAIPGALKAVGRMIADKSPTKLRDRRLHEIDATIETAMTGKSKYASGGAVEKIARKAVMAHVNTPAPKGHKGQRVCKADGGSLSNADREHMVVREKPGEKRKSLADLVAESKREWEKSERNMPKGGLSNADLEYLRAKSK
jgi:hypothetical protein